MSKSDKRNEDIKCKCKNSKCMKLYCECFASRRQCSRSCHCVDCQNTCLRDTHSPALLPERRGTREQLIRSHRGCACRKSGCTKKYCECFQAGILCKDICKCVDCQNNESLTNQRVMAELRRKESDIFNPENSHKPYPLYISQNSENLHSILVENNPLDLDSGWVEDCARSLLESVRADSAGGVLEQMVSILKCVQEGLTHNMQAEQFSLDASNLIKQQRFNQANQQHNSVSDNSESYRKFSNIIIPPNPKPHNPLTPKMDEEPSEGSKHSV